MYKYRSVSIVPSLMLVLMGSLDCITTVIGIAYFGAVEANPVMAGLTTSSLPIFTMLKIASTIIIGTLFFEAEKCLVSIKDKQGKSYKLTQISLRIANVGAIAFLLAVVINNLFVVLA
jgi:hypothetical protein